MRIKRSIIKKKCKLFNKIINNINNNDGELYEITMRINKEMRAHFGCNILDYEYTKSMSYQIIREYYYFQINEFLCDANFDNNKIFINFNRIIKINITKKEIDYYLDYVKRLSLSNFIIKYLNKDGLAIIERIMFDIL